MSSIVLNSVCAAQSVGMVNNMVSTLLQALLTAQCAISTPKIWPEDYGDVALRKPLDTYDFIVVGAGSAGSVVASRLSENPDWKVLVLEAGGDPPQESEVPQLLFTMQHTNFTWNYWTESNGKSCLGFKNGACYWPRGKMIGGTGAVNGMIYLRGNRKDYDTWLQRGNHFWGWNDVLPYFRKSVRPVGNETHPQGYVTLSAFPRVYLEVEDMIYAGAAQLGLPHVLQFTDGSETGYSNAPGTVQNGRRTSSGKGHLSRVSGRNNLHVIKNAQVSKIHFDVTGKTAESVTFTLRGQKELNVKIGKELVLSAGSIETPKLLMLSGIGPREHLESMNIPVLKNLPIGANLQDHAFVPIFIKLNEHTALPVREEDTLDSIYQYLIHRKGPLNANGISITSFLNTKEGSTSPYPDVEHHHLYFQRGDFDALRTIMSGASYKDSLVAQAVEILQTANLLTVFVVLSNPTSVGHIRLRSANYEDAPIISPNYLAEFEDVETLVRGIQHLLQLEQTAAFRANAAQVAPMYIKECVGKVFPSDDYWRCYTRHMATTIYHHVGTVKMGPKDDETACVNPRLQLYGVRNLRVVDASIMPIIPSCNTNGPTLMVAERGADFIKEDWLQVFWNNAYV